MTCTSESTESFNGGGLGRSVRIVPVATAASPASIRVATSSWTYRSW